jgi:type I restriction enzyme S subunit
MKDLTTTPEEQGQANTKSTKEEKGLRPLPDGWVWTTVGQVTQPIEKVSPGQKPDIPFVYIDISSIDNSIQKIVEPKEYLGSEAPSRARQLVRANDVVFSTVRTYLKNVALVPETYDGQIASTGFSVLRANDSTQSKFLFYFTLTDEFLFPLNELQRGTSYPAVRDGDVRVQPFPLPPMPEQERIVSRLEELLSDLDAGVAALERVRAGVKRYKASVLKAACEGKLFGEKPEGLPEGWRQATVAELSDGSKHALKAGPFGSSLKKEFYVPKGYKIYGQEQVIRGDPYFGDYYINEDRYQQLKSNAVKPGDILISLVGTIGKVLILPGNIEPGIINPRLVKLSLDRNLIDSRYFKFYMETETAKHYFSTVSHGETMDVLNLGILKTLPIPIPPLEEQRRIVAEVERRLELARAVESAVEVGLKRAARLRQAVLWSAFEGRL